MKKLYLLRHAKSSWKDSSLTDEQRPLSKRGNKNAPQMGEYLAQRGIRLDRVISSPATRALTTARLVVSALEYDLDAIVHEPRLYFCGSRVMLDVLRETDDAVSNLMMVGHNPDMTSFVNSLCGYQTDNVPTCGLTTIEFDGRWAAVDTGDGRLLDYKIPREL
jgi:phosphohistidine phosphatase